MTLLIDSYDSFVYSVKLMLERLSNGEVRVVRNDKINLSGTKILNPSHIVLSPGPRHPKDSGICLKIFKERLKIPVLGICLGHQALGLSLNAKTKRLQNIARAKSSTLSIKKESILFKNLPKSFNIMCYYSLEVVELDENLETLAYSEGGTLMAMQCTSLPYFGIRFHPESYFSECGLQIFSNFLNENKKEIRQDKNLNQYLYKLGENIALESEDFKDTCEFIMSKEYEPLQIAALLILTIEKSLDQKSLSAFVQNILRCSKTFSDESEMIDICGTGDDGFKSINASTAVAFILVSSGIEVVKHGNRAVSSSSGSSDILEALQIPVLASLEESLKLLEEKNFNFFHALFFHPLVGKLREIRSKLGVRAVFNALGPLLHPNLKFRYRPVGDYHAPVHRLLAEVLKSLGRKHVLVVRGDDGADELSICDESKIIELKDNEIYEYNIAPEQFGFKRAFHSEILGSSPENNAKDLELILNAKLKGAKFDIIVLNAMFALYTANEAASPLQAKDVILEALNSGLVYEFFKAHQNDKA